MGFIVGLLAGAGTAYVLLRGAKPVVVSIAKRKTRELATTQIPAEYGVLARAVQIPGAAAALADLVIGPALEQGWPV